MPSTTHGAGGPAFAHPARAHPANCAYLHSAFGPGCPYCRQAATGAAPPRAVPAPGAASRRDGRAEPRSSLPVLPAA